jgi:hypothetical protein
MFPKHLGAVAVEGPRKGISETAAYGHCLLQRIRIFVEASQSRGKGLSGSPASIFDQGAPIGHNLIVDLVEIEKSAREGRLEVQ